ncbi:unnamed protein product [Ectocarpus sp. 13 AM-2016]
MEQTTLVAYEKVAETLPDAKVLLVLRFGNYVKSKHTGRDGTPLVTMEVETEGGMICWSGGRASWTWRVSWMNAPTRIGGRQCWISSRSSSLPSKSRRSTGGA